MTRASEANEVWQNDDKKTVNNVKTKMLPLYGKRNPSELTINDEMIFFIPMHDVNKSQMVVSAS